MPDAGPTPIKWPDSWPAAADAGAAARFRERFVGLGQSAARLARSRGDLLDALGGNSPYLSDLALRESKFLLRMVAKGPDEVVGEVLARVARVQPESPTVELAALLRQAKRQVALATALADIGGVWDLQRVTGCLSDLAEAALRAAVAHLLRSAGADGKLRLRPTGDPSDGSGFVVLGMGKLGARELNYSSDIDLVLLYDPDLHPDLRDELGGRFSRIARGLVTLMQARDANGYVFRTDLRLRPDPAATPPVVALPACIAYYESMGQNWERAAMLKARPVAGDLAMGQAFLAAIRPFIWRKHLDFAAVADIHAMKRRINAHREAGRPVGRESDPVLRIAGHDVKLGRGGIREIEFLVQTLQLVWGGREPGLRDPTTLGAMRLLVRAGHLAPRAATELAAAYKFLRLVEHRLQMVADRQTHRLPEQREQVEAFALFMGYADGAALARKLLRHLCRVRARYGEVFEVVPGTPEGCGKLDFRGATDRPGTLAALTDLGFKNPQVIMAAVRGWQAGRLRALRSLRAREVLDQVLPSLLAALARQAQPDVAFVRFDAFLSKLPAGVQILSLFQRNPALIDRVATVLGAAPSLADHLANVPAALEGLLSPAAPVPPRMLLRQRLGDATDLETAIGVISRALREEDFSLSVATMEGRLDANAAGLARTELADAAMALLLPLVLADHASRFGRVRGGGMVVVAMGKAGGREMMAGSDLDLMLIYDHPERVSESTKQAGSAQRPLPASQWYIRAAHAIVAALTSPGPDGPMYAVDMRLRPSGRKGPVAVSLTSFNNYHRESAWTWERMALTRARVVAGPAALRKRVEAAIHAAMLGAGESEKIRRDAASMRARLARDLPPSGPWDVKLRPGGQMEVEFVAQVLQLGAAAVHPEVASPTTRIALQRLEAAGLLDADDSALLRRADHVWRSVQGLLRIMLGRGAIQSLPEPVVQALVRAVGPELPAAVDMDGLRASLDLLAEQVRATFTRIVGAPDSALLEEK
jgi:glutamate-ammonia-ligase adenylyltransferase